MYTPVTSCRQHFFWQQIQSSLLSRLPFAKFEKSSAEACIFRKWRFLQRSIENVSSDRGYLGYTVREMKLLGWEVRAIPSKGIRRFIRFLTAYIILVGAAVLLAPKSMSKLSRWFGDNPRYLRLVGILEIGLGIWLAKQQYQEETPPQPWWHKWR